MPVTPTAIHNPRTPAVTCRCLIISLLLLMQWTFVRPNVSSLSIMSRERLAAGFLEYNRASHQQTAGATQFKFPRELANRRRAKEVMRREIIRGLRSGRCYFNVLRSRQHSVGRMPAANTNSKAKGKTGKIGLAPGIPCRICRMSAGRAFAERTSLPRPRSGPYQASFASIANENARRHKQKAMIDCPIGREAAGTTNAIQV